MTDVVVTPERNLVVVHMAVGLPCLYSALLRIGTSTCSGGGFTDFSLDSGGSEVKVNELCSIDLLWVGQLMKGGRGAKYDPAGRNRK